MISKTKSQYKNEKEKKEKSVRDLTLVKVM